MTNELRQLIKSKLDDYGQPFDIKQVYYQLADDDAMFPHIVFTLDNSFALADDFNRIDYDLTVDIYFKKESRVDIEDLCDSIIKGLNASNLPQDAILPTFIYNSYRVLIDEDKNIDRRQLTFNVQCYERT